MASNKSCEICDDKDMCRGDIDGLLICEKCYQWALANFNRTDLHVKRCENENKCNESRRIICLNCKNKRRLVNLLRKKQRQSKDKSFKTSNPRAISSKVRPNPSDPSKEYKTICEVCGDDHEVSQFIEALVCFSCLDFYFADISYESIDCVNYDEKCVTDVVNRDKCSRCRYLRCITIGMNRFDLLIDNFTGFIEYLGDNKNECQVCGEHRKGLVHYNNALVCYSCQLFFQKAYFKSHEYKCNNNNEMCRNLDECQKCRYTRCLAVGMDCFEELLFSGDFKEFNEFMNKKSIKDDKSRKK